MEKSRQNSWLDSRQNFSKKVQELYETDIGDFKRKILTYLNRLGDEQKDPSLKASLHQLKESLICNNTRNIEELRSQVSDRISQIVYGQSAER